MLRAIVFVDCDYCHQSYSKIESVSAECVDYRTDWSHVAGDLQESALGDGWILCLHEDTGTYGLMCCACEEGLTLEQHLTNSGDDDFECDF